MENERTPKKRLQTTLVLTLLICLIDIYIIINIPEDYIILAASAIITMIFALLSVNSWFKWKETEGQIRNEQYSDIMSVQKSSYVVIQKKVQDIDDKINFIGQKIMNLEKAGDVDQRKISSILDNIVDDQKKIAKITVSRSKENAEALMNSNDKLLLQMEEFRNSIASMQEQLLTRQGEIHNQESQELIENKKEILSRVMELKELLVKEADEISENILNSKQSLEESYNNVMEAAAEAKEVHPAETNITETAEQEMAKEAVISEESSGSVEEHPELSENAPQKSVDESIEASAEDLTTPATPKEQEAVTESVAESMEAAQDVTPEDLPVNANEQTSLPESAEQSLMPEDLTVPQSMETEQNAMPKDLTLPEPEEAEQSAVPEEVAIPQSVEAEHSSTVEDITVPQSVETGAQNSVPEDTAVPQSVEAAKHTSIDSISAPEPNLAGEQESAAGAAYIQELLKESQQTSAVDEQPAPMENRSEKQAAADSSVQNHNDSMSPEDIAALIANTESEELPEMTEKFQEEEKPPVPDMSDPNRPMSPEDIAALIANM
ncbi:MAG: hypothetical protein HFI69_05845 [Lachnospiraceae bacterium]|nr:hypothetical protein [Lachnospiraceae bacterium]